VLLRAIESIENGKINIKGCARPIPISRRNYDKVKDAYFHYLIKYM